MAVLSVAESLALVLTDAQPLPPQETALADAWGRVLAAGLEARRTHPPAPVSSMDGYAVRAADVGKAGARLAVVGEVAAGRVLDREIGPGEAARIFTGATLPGGADTVVIQENVTRQGDAVVVNKPAPRGCHVRPEGLDFRAGAALLAKGRRLTVRDVGLAGAMNHAAIPVHRRPRIAVLSTGDELVLPGEPLAPGRIVTSNAFMLMALARREGAEALDLGIVPDRLDATTAAVRRARAAAADVLVTIGGASVGDYDFVQRALKAEGVTLAFWKVALRPGRPLMCGRLGDTHVLGLPGNPVSSFVCAILFLVPLLRRLSGRTDVCLPETDAVLGCDLPANDERADYLRAVLKTAAPPSGIPVATPFPRQDSSMLVPLTQADCLIVREPFAPAAQAGARCRVVNLEF